MVGRFLFQCSMSKETLATVSAKAECYIGTQGGGMDQAIAFLAKAGEFILSWKEKNSPSITLTISV